MSAICVSAMLLSLAATSIAQTVKVQYTFNGEGATAYPDQVTLAQGRDAKLYGTAEGGANSAGEEFRDFEDLLSAIHLFDTTGGATPVAGVLLSSDGTFYGTTPFGGSAGAGVLYRVTSSGVFSVLHDFTGGADGGYPAAPPIEASDGNLYGTTSGTSTIAATVYRYDRAGSFATLRQLQQTEGTFVSAPLVQGTDGNLYGVAPLGGAKNCGSVFKLTPQGAMLFVRSFPCGAAGSIPMGSLTQASDGNFYGTTEFGGTAVNQFGTVFRITPTGKVSRLYSFQGGSDGANPFAGLAQSTDSKLYGVAALGGDSNSGTLFQISTAGEFKALHSFTREEAFSAIASLMQHTSGLFYGTSTKGGANAFGTIYSLDMGLGPFVTFVQPTGKVGQKAQILGQALTGTTSVTFNGVPATNFKVSSDTFMTAVVPDGATTGPVVVKTPTGSLTSNVSFRVSK